MVQRKGEKKGVKTGSTIRDPRATWHPKYNGGGHGGGAVITIDKDGEVVRQSLNKSKNWEIIENAPKHKPTISREERKEKNRIEKKHDFEDHLKTRGHHKEPPAPKKKKGDEESEDTVKAISKKPTRTEPIINEETKYYVVQSDESRKVGSNNDTRSKGDPGNNSVIIDLAYDEKDLLLHRPRIRRGSFDYWDTTPFQKVLKNDIGIDFKLDGFLKRV
jgi:hypothetical protein